MKKLIISIAAVALLSLMIGGVYAVYAVDTCPPGLTPGFWKHNVGVLLGYNNGSYSSPTGSIWVSQDTMESWLLLHWTIPELQTLYGQLSYQGGGAAGALIRNTAANDFNMQAGLASLP